MPLSRRAFSVLISLLILASVGCRQERFIQTGMIEVPGISLPVGPGTVKMSYRTRLFSASGEISGILLIKKMDGDAYRIAFFSEMGMSYFEATMGPESYPYSLSFNNLNPLLARGNSIESLETLLNQLLIPGKVLNNAKAVRDENGKTWLKAALDDGRYYFGSLDAQGHLVQSFFSKKDKPEGGIQADLEYQPEVEGMPVHARLTGKRGEVVIDMQVLE